MQRNTTRVNHMLDFWRRGANAGKKPTNAFWHPSVVISNTLATVWIAYRGSVVKCPRSQVRPFHEDDEAAHEHVTEHMKKRNWRERPQQEGDFSYEDITGQDEPPVDSPSVPGESTVTKPPRTQRGRTDGSGPRRTETNARKKLELSARNKQPPHVPMRPQMLHDKRQRETIMTREDESMSLKHRFHQLLKTKLRY